MDGVAHDVLVRVIAALTDAEFNDLVQEARGGDTYTPTRRDYADLRAEFESQGQPQRRAQIADQIRTLIQKGG